MTKWIMYKKIYDDGILYDNQIKSNIKLNADTQKAFNELEQPQLKLGSYIQEFRYEKQHNGTMTQRIVLHHSSKLILPQSHNEAQAGKTMLNYPEIEKQASLITKTHDKHNKKPKGFEPIGIDYKISIPDVSNL